MKNSGKKKLSTEPYKGVRDFYPEDMFIQNYIANTMREVVEKYGYAEYSSSILEPAELYEGKTSEEIVNEQTYTFTDRGDRRVTLRPEMTPSVARLVAARKRELAFPLRWYSVPNVFRYERPQRGRLREHWQLNCDIFGVAGIEAEIEIISLAANIMRALGAKDTEYEIRINNRKSLNKLLNEFSVSEEQKKEFLRLLDKRDKIENFDEKAKDILGSEISLDFDIDAETKNIIEELKARNVKNVVFSPTLVRGFDYYTGTVFEVFDLAPGNNRSLFGGGRYDNLLDIFGMENIPAVGFGMGDVTIKDFLETHALLPEYAPNTDLYIATVGPEHIADAQELADKLREQGINVAVNMLDKKIGDQIKTAAKQAIPFLIAVGEDEAKTKNYIIKNLNSGKEIKTKEEEIADKIWSENV